MIDQKTISIIRSQLSTREKRILELSIIRQVPDVVISDNLGYKNVQIFRRAKNYALTKIARVIFDKN
jgi:hypothetical protein